MGHRYRPCTASVYGTHTLLLHCCYTVATLLLHCCYTVVTLVLHCCYTAVTLLLHCCYILWDIAKGHARPVSIGTHSHTHTHTHTHTYTYTNTCARTYTKKDTCTHTFLHTRPHTSYTPPSCRVWTSGPPSYYQHLHSLLASAVQLNAGQTSRPATSVG
jgi:hypothetical protein